MHIQRLLILAGEELADARELPPGVRTLVDDAASVFVVAPTTPSRLHWLYSDVDGDRRLASERLERLIDALGSVGVSADGEVGADMPSLAMGDAIRRVRPDHILCLVHRSSHRAWHLIERTEREFGVPVTVFELDAAGHPATAS